MAKTFVSEATNLWIALDDKITVRFVNAKADIAATARRYGISEEEIVERLKASRYYGIRFWEAPQVEQQEAPPPPPPPPAGDPTATTETDLTEVDGLPPYNELKIRAQELGLPYVGVKHEDLAESVHQAEQLMRGQ